MSRKGHEIRAEREKGEVHFFLKIGVEFMIVEGGKEKPLRGNQMGVNNGEG